MFLDLTADVLGELMDRVRHLGRSLARSKRDALESQSCLGDLAIGYRRVALFVELDIQHCQLRNLFSDPAESFRHMAPKLVGHLDVPPPYLDPHLASFGPVARSYVAPLPGTMGFSRDLAKDAA
jgi:hypothetical protein